jgi:hypothetical protein
MPGASAASPTTGLESSFIAANSTSSPIYPLPVPPTKKPEEPLCRLIEKYPVLSSIRKAIENRPFSPAKSPKACARLVIKLLRSDFIWKDQIHLRPGGAIYEALADRAMSNRKKKEQRSFKKRFGVTPARFRNLTEDQKMEVKDLSPRGEKEPLSVAKTKTAHKRATRIETMRPTPKEFRSALMEGILASVKSLTAKPSPD